MTSKPKLLGRFRLFETIESGPLTTLLQVLDDRVLDEEFYDFEELWMHFVREYLNDKNKAILLQLTGQPRVEEVSVADYGDLPLKAKRMFTTWVEEIGAMREARYHDPASCPSWELMDADGGIRPADWLLHITDHAEQIVRAGFLYGQPDPNHIAITFRHNMFAGPERIGSQEEGYNFAYELDQNIDARMLQAQSGNYYGKQAVLFKAPHIIVEHYTDRETQAVFWGQDATQRHALLFSENGWYCPEIKGQFERITDLTSLIVSGRAAKNKEAA